MNILLVCTQGMSTNMLAESIRKASALAGEPAGVKAVGIDNADYEIGTSKYDIVMVGPQAAYMKDELIAPAKAKGLEVVVINYTDYGQMRGDRVWKTAKKIVEEQKGEKNG